MLDNPLKQTVAGVNSPKALDRLLGYSDKPLMLIFKALKKVELTEQLKLKALNLISEKYSKINYNSFTAYLRELNGETIDLSDIKRYEQPMECFEFSLIMKELLPTLGFVDTSIIGTSYSEDQNESGVAHTAIICTIDNKKYCLDPFNNLRDIFEVKDGIKFSDKRGKDYTVSCCNEEGFSLSYMSSKGKLKTVKYQKLSTESTNLGFKSLIKSDNLRVLYALYKGQEPKWLKFDPEKSIITSNIAELNNIYLYNLNRETLIFAYEQFKDLNLVKNLQNLQKLY
jgi:hypothetical protein